MIEMWTGTPGSGKSLHMVHEIRQDLKIGKRVICTTPIDTRLVFMNIFQRFWFWLTDGKKIVYTPDKRQDNFYFIDIMQITPAYLYDFAARHHVEGKEHQTRVYLDECVAIFSPTVIGDDVKTWNEWDKFFRVHRHLGFDVILIPQSDRLISRKVKCYSEYEVKHFNRKNHGMLGFWLSLFIGGLFSYSVCWRGTHEKPLEQGWFTYTKYYGRMYNSYCLFGDTLKPYQEAYRKKQEAAAALCAALLERRKQLEDLETCCSSDCCFTDTNVDINQTN